MVPSTHTVVVCVMKGWRGEPLITVVLLKFYYVKRGVGRGVLVNMEPLKLSSSRALFGIDPHSGSVYPNRGCLCYEGMEGGTPDNRGALKVVVCEKGGAMFCDI